MSTTTLPLSIGVTELTLADGSVTELVMSSVIDNKPYYDLAFAAAKVYTDAQDAAYLVTTQNEFTAADAVVLSSANTYTDTSSSNAITTAETFATAGDTAAKAFAIQRANHTGAQSVSTITGLAPVATSGLKSDVGLGNVDNTSDVNKPVSTAQAAADLVALNTAKAYTDASVIGLLQDCGNWDASGNVYPVTGGSGSGGAIARGDVFFISVAGTLGGVAVNIADTIRALSDTPAQVANQWATTEGNLGYTPENTANKATNLSSNDNTHYPTTAAVQTAINTREPSITADLVTKFWSGTKTFRDLATDVRAVVLTGLSTATATTVTSSDTTLSATGKLQAQITALAPKTFNQSRWSFTNLDSTTLSGGYVAGGSAGATLGSVNSQMQDGINGMRYQPLKIGANGEFVKVSATHGFKLQTGRCCRTVFSIYADAAQSTLIGFVSSDNIATENNMVAFSIIGLQAKAYVSNSAGGSTNLGTQNFPSTAVTLPTLTALVADIEYLTDSSVRMVLWNLNTNAKYIDVTFSGNGVPALNASGFGGYIPHKAISTAATNYGVELISLGYMGRGIARPPEIQTPP